jgi:flagellar hook-associated protein 1 FlgK
MSASPLLSLGIRAMAANYAALQTTGHNISNANVAGYSRQQVELVTSQGQFTGAGFFGKGVDVATVTRSHNSFLTAESRRAMSLAALDSARQQQLQGLENVFKTGEAGLGHSVSTFLNTLTDLASRPADLAVRQVVLTRANDLAARFSEAGQQLDDIQNATTAELRTHVTAINQLAGSIALANDKAASLKGLGQPANDVLDERDRLVARLSELVQVSTVEASDGTVGVFIGGGQRLVLGNEAAELAVRQSPDDPRRSAVGLVNGPLVNLIEPAALGGGKVAGLLRFQNTDLVDGRNLVGRLAAEVALAVNQQQERGLNLRAQGADATTPALFSLHPPRALPNANNALDGNGRPVGQLRLAYTGEPGALKASDYALAADPDVPGNWLVTRLVGGQPSNDPADRLSFPGPSASFQGITIDWTDAPPEPGDRFLLQTVNRGANDLAVNLRDPRDLAAAARLSAAAAPGNRGTLQVASLAVTASPLPWGAAEETLSFTRLSPPVNGFEYSVTSSLTGSTFPWNPGQTLVGDNGWRLELSGVPGSDDPSLPSDTLVISPIRMETLNTNNGNARELLALRDAVLVDGGTATDGYAQAMAEIGARVQSSASTASISAAVAAQAEQQRSGQAGVNLDEEAARLIQFQQAYQASAKMLQVAQSLFDTLLQTTGR